MQRKGVNQILLAVGLAASVGLAGCSGGDASPVQDQGPVTTTDNLEGLVGGEPLDQIQVGLDAVLIDTLAANLPSDAGKALVESFSNAILTLIDAPDELLETLMLSQELFNGGDSDPATFQTLLGDSGAEVLTHTQSAVSQLLAGLQTQASASDGAGLSSAIAALSALNGTVTNPESITSSASLAGRMSTAVAALRDLDIGSLELPASSQTAVSTVVDLAAFSLEQTAAMIVGFGQSTGAPSAALLDPIEQLLTGIRERAVAWQSSLDTSGSEKGLDLTEVIDELVIALDEILMTGGLLEQVVYFLYDVLVAILTPVTGGLSALLCGLLPICD